MHAHDIVTAKEIHAILGPVDEELLSLIQGTGANRSEVLQAYDLYSGGGNADGLGLPMHRRIQAVYSILEDMDGNDRGR